jgi:hypothetical protein
MTPIPNAPNCPCIQNRSIDARIVLVVFIETLSQRMRKLRGDAANDDVGMPGLVDEVVLNARTKSWSFLAAV